MFIQSSDGWLMEHARTHTMQCTKCSNTTNHRVWVYPGGLQFGTVFSKKKLSTNKQYFLQCPTCGNFSQQITREQANSLRVG